MNSHKGTSDGYENGNDDEESEEDEDEQNEEDYIEMEFTGNDEASEVIYL